MIDHLFEISFEVCNKVGGIYTVVRTKAPILQTKVQNYFAIGPYFAQKAQNEFVQLQIPQHLEAAFHRANQRGVQARFGKWLIEGEPQCILIDFSQVYAQKDQFKKDLWDYFGVDSLNGGFEFDEPLTFSLACGILIEELSHNITGKTVVHSHEWMTGFTNLYLKIKKANAKTVFTTHATMLGRSLTSRGVDLNATLHSINPIQSAHDCNVFEKYSAEKACALHSNEFTTVSDMTAQECEHFFGRKPTVVENGISLFPSFEQNAVAHVHWKQRLHEFVRYFFFPYEQLDIDKTTLLFTSGRYEFRNKGMDVTIKTLARLNEQLKRENSDKTVVFFFFVPSKTYGMRKDVAQQKLMLRHMSHVISTRMKDISEEIFDSALTQKDMSVFDIKTKNELQKIITLFKKNGNAPLSTHDIDSNDSIITQCAKEGLQNSPSDRVKVVFYPLYLDGNDGLLDGSYYEVTSGCHLGLFLSSYEPWGYTPAECAACSVPAMTTTSAGFGQYIHSLSKKREGIFVLDRAHKSDEDIIRDAEYIIHDFIHLSHHQRVKHKVVAKLQTESLEWENLIEKYLKVYDHAN